MAVSTETSRSSDTGVEPYHRRRNRFRNQIKVRRNRGWKIDVPALSLGLDPDDFLDFVDHLHRSKRICALLGAGLSVPSGIPTFRGKNGLWRGVYQAADVGVLSLFLTQEYRL